MIEVSLLATSLITSFFVPLFKKGAEGLVSDLREELTDDIAEGVASEATGLWQKLKDKFTGSSDDADDADDTGDAEDTPEKVVVESFEKAPDLMKQPLEELLKQVLEQDPEFRGVAERLVEKGTPAGSITSHVVGDNATVGNVQTGNVSGGTVAGVIQGGRPSPPLPAPAPSTAPDDA